MMKLRLNPPIKKKDAVINAVDISRSKGNVKSQRKTSKAPKTAIAPKTPSWKDCLSEDPDGEETENIRVRALLEISYVRETYEKRGETGGSRYAGLEG